MRRVHRYILMLCFAGAALCAGCAGSARKSAAEEGLMPGAVKEFADLPVPVGFHLEKAYSFDVPPNRMFLLEYVGKSDMTKAKVFYKSEMTTQGWAQTCESTYGKIVFLDFEKKGERCVVKLEAERGKVRVTFRSHR